MVVEQVPQEIAAARVCYLTTTGRVTGRPHEIEIWFAVDPQSSGRRLFFLAGGRWKADWVRNLHRNPAVRVRVGDTLLPGTARVLAPDDPLDSRAREALADKYGQRAASGGLNRWARESLAVAVEF